MEFNIIGQGENAVAVVQGGVVATAQDMLDIIATAYYQHNCANLVLHKENINENFFDLKTGLLGEALQKVINYGARLAIVGSFAGYTSKPLQDFIYESNKGSRVFFLPDEKTAIEKLQAASR